MSENLYNSEIRGKTSPALMKVPKNVRQIGQVNDVKKIYVEDYVMSYIKKLGTKKDSSSELVVLLGQFVRINNCQCIFISGAIEIKNVLYDDNLLFTNEVWTNIYDTIKQYFSNVEIVGWSIIRAGLPLNVDERIRKVHVDNFAGQDKTLLLYDSLEREEVFYVFEGNVLVRQDGYYIFYDKNAEMQDYITALRGEEKQEHLKFTTARPVSGKPEGLNEQVVPIVKKKSGLMYGIGAAAAVVVLVISAATLNGYDSNSKNPQDSMGVVSDNVQGQEVNSGEVLTTDEASLPVETAQGKLETINNNENDNDEEVVESTEKAPVKKNEEKESNKVPNKSADKKESAEKKSEPEAEPKPDKKETSSKQDSSEVSTSKNYYVVKKGDTLISIAVKLYDNKGYVSEIKELNNIEDSDKITVGQKLLLP